MADFYFAQQNDDGTYGELQRWDGVKEITLSSSDVEENATPLVPFKPEEITFEFEPPVWMLFWVHHIRMSVLKSCSTCKNCKEMYRYPNYVDAEECICTQGLECDTWWDKVRNCPKWEYRDFFEPRQRNPDLDKYPYGYIVKGDYEDV